MMSPGIQTLLLILTVYLLGACSSDCRSEDPSIAIAEDQGNDVLKRSRPGSGHALPGLEVRPQDLTQDDVPSQAPTPGNEADLNALQPPGDRTLSDSERQSNQPDPYRDTTHQSPIGSYFYLNHRGGEQFGQAQPDTAVGMFYPLQVDDGIWFAQPQAALSNDGQFGSGVSFGRRWFDAPANRVFGAALSLDAYQTQMNEVAPQGVLSLEARGRTWDIFSNGYLPLGDRTRRAASANYGPVMFQGGNLVANILRDAETSMSGCDVQLARRLGTVNAWGFGGWYHFEGGGQSLDGVLAGLRGYPGDRVALDGTVSHDPLFGTNVGFTATMFFGGTSRGRVSPDSIRQRMAEPLNRRDSSVQFARPVVTGTQVLTRSGAPISIAHVNSSGAAGTGTVVNPFGSLTAAAGSPADIVLLHADSVFTGEQISLQPGQRLLGASANTTHEVLTDQLGSTALPQPSNGMNVPLIQNAPGNAVTLAPNSVVSNIRIQNAGAVGVFANSGGPILIDRVFVQGSAGPGLMFQVTGSDTMNATVTGSAFNGNAAPSTFQFGPNAGALMNLNLVGNEDSVGYNFERDPNGFLRIGGTLGTGDFFNDDNGNVANNGNTTLGGPANIAIVGAGNQIQIIPPPSIIVP